MLTANRIRPLLPLLLLVSCVARAGWNISPEKRYYITCSYASGYICPGSLHDSSYDVLYDTSSPKPASDDGYWLLSLGDEGYTMCNSKTGQYLVWVDKYGDNCKYLTLSNQGTGEEALWTLTQGSGFVSVRSVAQPSYQFNLRKDSYLMGCYESNTTDDNEQFHIICEDDGKEISFANVSVSSISLSAMGEASVETGGTLQLTAEVAPSDADNKELQWTSDNTSVAQVSQSGLVTGIAQGTATIKATATDDSGVSASLTVKVTGTTYVGNDGALLYLRQDGGVLLALPSTLIDGDGYAWESGHFEATLIDGQPLDLYGVTKVWEGESDDCPGFATYKFNNKYNSQLFTDAECESPQASTLSLTAGCIGKWLTASFTFTDEGTEARVDGVLQHSKKTRQSFASPVTYTLTNPQWQLLRMRVDDDGSAYTREYSVLERKVTVSVDFLTDHPTSEYGVPRIDLTLANSSAWSSSNWIGMHGKTTYEDATITIDGAGVFPDMPSTPIQIKGRGNTSWSSSYQAKNPYHFKFDTKQKPLGMKNGKHWILLANNQTGSMTSNALGHKVGNLLETAGTNHIVPVELYINGSYRGSYNLTERIGFANNSIDLDDETYAAMIELDTYTDETIYWTNAYRLPAKIHKPDIGEEGVTLTASEIIDDFNSMVSSVYKGSDTFLQQVDADNAARYLLACDIILNQELKHPKSVFLYTENVSDYTEGDDPTPWILGPLWDCDWAFGYQDTYTYFINNADLDLFSYLSKNSTNNAGPFFNALRYNATDIDRLYYKLAYQFVNQGLLDELTDYCQEYYDYASASFAHNTKNATNSTDGYNYSTLTANSQTWLAKRAASILSRLTPYDITDDDDASAEETLAGDANQDGLVGIADLVCLLNHSQGLPNDTFDDQAADTDANGILDDADASALLSLLLTAEPDSWRAYSLPLADISWSLTDTNADAFSLAELPLTLCVDEGGYCALQADLRLPEGSELSDITLPLALEGMRCDTSEPAEGVWRIVLYSDASLSLPSHDVTITLSIATGTSGNGQATLTSATASTLEGEEERLPSLSCAFNIASDDSDSEGEEDGIKAIGTSSSSRGATYDLSGRRVTNTNTHGVYIIGGRKVVK